MPICRAYKERSIRRKAKQKTANTTKTSQQSFHTHEKIVQSKFQPMSTFRGQGMVKKRIFSHIDGRQYAKSQNLKFSRKNGIYHQMFFTMIYYHTKNQKKLMTRFLENAK
jgi:hypothetical protein